MKTDKSLAFVLCIAELMQDIFSPFSLENSACCPTGTDFKPWLTHSPVDITWNPLLVTCPLVFFSDPHLHKSCLLSMDATQAHSALWNH